MKVKINLYYDDKKEKIVEIIHLQNDYIVRDEKDLTPVSKDFIKHLSLIGNIYSTKVLDLKGRWELNKIDESGNSDLCERGQLTAPLQEGLALKIIALRAYYKTNIVTAITKETNNTIEFYTLSGSFYRLTRII